MLNFKNLGTKIYLLRQRVGLTQNGLAMASGIGVKTLSSFETGMRTYAMKVAQLDKIVTACGWTLERFFSWDVENLDEIVDDDDLDDLSIDERYDRLSPVSPYPTLQSSLNPNHDIVLRMHR